MKRFCVTALAAAGVLFALSASAQFKKPEDAVHFRQSVMTVMGFNMARIAAMTTGKAPFDAATAATASEIVALLSKEPYLAFIDGTSNAEMPGKTRAKPEIWMEPDKFKSAATKMQDAVAQMHRAALSGNPDQMKTAFGTAAKACKACHDDFQAK